MEIRDNDVEIGKAVAERISMYEAQNLEVSKYLRDLEKVYCKPGKRGPVKAADPKPEPKPEQPIDPAPEEPADSTPAPKAPDPKPSK